MEIICITVPEALISPDAVIFPIIIASLAKTVPLALILPDAVIFPDAFDDENCNIGEYTCTLVSANRFIKLSPSTVIKSSPPKIN